MPYFTFANEKRDLSLKAANESKADSLVHYLKQRCGIQDIRCEKVPRGDDPPDFWLSIDGKIFAAKDTSIVEEAAVKCVHTARKKGSIRGILGPFKWEGEDTACWISAVRLSCTPDGCRDAILLLYDAHGYGDAQDA
jgi:hypothetical protein